MPCSAAHGKVGLELISQALPLWDSLRSLEGKCSGRANRSWHMYRTYTHMKCIYRQLANVRQEYKLKINVSSYIKHALK